MKKQLGLNSSALPCDICNNIISSLLFSLPPLRRNLPHILQQRKKLEQQNIFDKSS